MPLFHQSMIELFFKIHSYFSTYPKKVNTYLSRKTDRNYNILNAISTIPKITSTTPVARFNVSGFALFAKRAAILAHRNVNSTHSTRQVISGMPPIAK